MCFSYAETVDWMKYAANCCTLAQLQLCLEGIKLTELNADHAV